MSKRVVAISTGVSYLDKNKWCVKDLKIGHRLDGTPFWFVSGLGCNFDNEETAEDAGLIIAKTMKVPYFFNVKHGDRITPQGMRALKAYDVIVK